MSIKPTPEQLEFTDKVMAQMRERIGDRAKSPEVARLVVEIMGHIMNSLNKDDSDLDPIGAMFAVGMVCNSLAMVFTQASDGVMTEVQSKSQAMNIFAYAMRQQVFAVEVDTDASPSFTNHGPVTEH